MNKRRTPSRYLLWMAGAGVCLGATMPAYGAIHESAPMSSNSESRRIDSLLSRLPLSFEVNQGQMDRRVKFASRGQGYNLYLTANEAVLALYSGGQSSARRASGARHASGARQASTTTAENSVLRFKLLGSKLASRISGLGKQAGVSNYFIGNKSSRWHRNVAHYDKVRYGAVYHGIDVVYYGNQRQLEYDFHVAPGANPEAIKLGIEGAHKLSLNRTGDLVIDVDGRQVVQHAPVSYQTIAGKRVPVASRYTLMGDKQVGFTVGAYDRSKPLVIDPILSYSSYFGSTDFDSANGTTLDSQGFLYVAGQARGGDLPAAGAGVFQPEHSESYTEDAYVAKFDLRTPGSGKLVYMTYLGGSTYDYAYTVRLSGNNTYVFGHTQSDDFPTTENAYSSEHSGDTSTGDFFVTSLNSSGTALNYSTYFGGGLDEQTDTFSSGLAVDAAGKVYFCGFSRSDDYPTTENAYQVPTDTEDTVDAVITCLDTTKNGEAGLVYSTAIGGEDWDYARSVTLDEGGGVYVVGRTQSEFPTTPGVFQVNDPDASSTSDGWVAKFDINAETGPDSLVWATYLGGDYDDEPGSIVYHNNALYISGTTGSDDFPTTSGAFQTTDPDGVEPSYDMFVTKMNVDGTALIYSTYVGGTGYDASGGEMFVDGEGSAFITGQTYSADFPIVNGVDTTYDTEDNGDAFVLRLNPSGSAVTFSTYLGGDDDSEVGSGVAVDPRGNIYLVGSTNANDFPVTPDAVQPTKKGNNVSTIRGVAPVIEKSSDGFVAKIVPDNEAPTVIITTPQDGKAYQSFPAIAGTVADEPNGSGVESVVIYLFNKAGQSWNGSAFVSTPTALPTTLNPNGTWTYNGALPSGNNLQDTDYRVVAVATDRAGNQGDATQEDAQGVDTAAFVIDREAPLLAFTTPQDGDDLSVLTFVQGTVSDPGTTPGSNPQGTGVLGVSLYIRRESDGLFWNGNGWVATKSPLAAVLNGESWTVTSNLPPANQLRDGDYTLEASTTDRAGNSARAIIHITVDNAAPRVAFTNPQNGGSYPHFPSTFGTVIDNPGGGIDRVVLYIQRNSDGLYWNGTAFGPGATALPTTVSGNNWNYPGSLPDGDALANGSYTLFARAFDDAGNMGEAIARITVNGAGGVVALPRIAITNPIDGSLIRSLGLVTGTVNRATGDASSDVQRVDIVILHTGAGYWNGTSFVAAATPVAADLNGDGFALRTGLPATLLEGDYVIEARAYDAAGNQASAISRVTVDYMAPTVIFGTPVNGQVLRAFGEISGIARDSRLGTGVKKVELIFQRQSDRAYWTGRAWEKKAATLFVNYDATTQRFQYRGALPRRTDLQDGGYILTVRAYDGGNLAGRATVSVRILQNPVPPPSGDLSLAAASSARNLVALAFNRSLNANAANAASYRVQINGETVPVQSALVRGSVVTLLLGDGSVRPGDEVTVNWTGIPSTGSTAVVAR